MSSSEPEKANFQLSWGCVLLGLSFLLVGTYKSGTASGLTSLFFLVAGVALGVCGLFFIWNGYQLKMKGKQ
jgi:predicted phage tail protein